MIPFPTPSYRGVVLPDEELIKDGIVRLTTLVPSEVADTYRRAAELSGKSVSQIVREALEDHTTATRLEAEIVSRLEGNNPGAATAAYVHLAHAMHEEAIRAIAEAAVLDVHIAAARLTRAAAQLRGAETDKHDREDDRPL